MRLLPALVGLLALLVAFASAAPAWWDGARQPKPAKRAPRKQQDTYRALCRVINPDPYAFPGRAPFPGQPFCPF